jgi:hypothetical protein
MKPVFYRWSVGTKRGLASGGYADTAEDARQRILEVRDLYHQQGEVVTSYYIHNQDDMLILEVTNHA